MKRFFQTMFFLLLVLGTVSSLWAQPGPGRGRGPGRGFGFGPGGRHGQDDRHAEDRDVFHFLLTNHEKITRTVKERPDGVETLTESADAEVADKIKEHAHWMDYRIEHTNPIRMRDPLFAELFRHTDDIKMDMQETERGVRVIETSENPQVVKLIQAHAQVVSGFVERGFDEAMKNHPVPSAQDQLTGERKNPAIAPYGPVVQLAEAAQQPRNETRLVVDLTGGGELDKLLPSIEKIARFVNIYAGAGKEPASVNIAVVMHGKATLASLNADAYAARFGTEGNPNLDCLHTLHEAGVEIYVCGQSLAGHDAKADDVAVFVDVAVSALTSLANLQQDGYAYIPLGQ